VEAVEDVENIGAEACNWPARRRVRIRDAMKRHSDAASERRPSAIKSEEGRGDGAATAVTTDANVDVEGKWGMSVPS
jgi:hypothetical protein